MDKSLRKYSLIDSVVNEWQNENKKDCIGICVKKFKADFVIDNLSKYKLNDEIEVNGETCRVIQVGKRCFPDECPLYKKNNASCPLKDGVLFAG